jgi:hypothetical protein
MTQGPNAPATTDALLARYHAAQAALNAPEANGPSAQTRANILNYAAEIATNLVAVPAIKQRAQSPIDTEKPAANDGQWKIRTLATVAIFGLTSLLLLQWDRGTPEEKEVAFSTARPPVAARAESAAAPAAAPTPSSAPSTAPLPAPAITPPKADAPRNAAAPPAAKAAEYGAAQSARREGAASPDARLKKSDSTDAETSMQDKSASVSGFAAQLPNAALFAAIRSGDAAAVQQALANGADKNAKRNGTPAITLCVQSGKLNLVQLLAAAGADVNAPDAQGTTPLAHARARGFDAIANALLGLGAT